MSTHTLRINNRYIVHNLLGKGGMGAVYRVTDRLNGQVVALKQVTSLSEQLNITPTPGSENDFRLALSDEFRTLASLRHPNIISVLDYGFEENQPYFTMELLEKASSLVEAGSRLSTVQKVERLIDLLQALVYLHRRGVLHRDLKPTNILITRDDVLKVLDFGLSLSGAYSRSNVREHTVGTLAYMAPELFADEPASVASDLYAVGVIAYELMIGHHPYNQKNVAMLINSILSMPVDLSSLSPEFAPIIERLLAKQPQNRYTSASEVIHALLGAIGQPTTAENIAIRESFLQAAKFVGRKEELNQLKKALDETVRSQAANSQGSRAWLIGGESGVGKSRLLDELRIRALVRGALVLRGQAITQGGIPYQVWRDPLRRLILSVEINDEDAGVLKTLIPDIESLLERQIPDAPTLSPQLSQHRFIRVVTDLFSSLEHPTVVILEDLQWANQENIELLQRLIPMTKVRPLMLIASYRDDERPELRTLLADMQHLKLKRFDADGISELSESMLGDVGRHPRIIVLLQQETEGNVFFMVEIIRALADHVGNLERINEVNLTNLERTLLTDGIQNIVQNRLNRVPEDARALLRLAAVAGRELDLDVLQAFTTDINRWLEQCNTSAVIEVEQDRWRFAHDKLREGLLLTITTDELPTLHRRLAEMIENIHPDEPEYIPALARHYQAAGLHHKAAVHLAQAGDLALQGFANHEAIGFYRAALESLKQIPDHDTAQWQQLSLTIHENLGDVLELSGQHEEARQVLSAALRILSLSPEHSVRLARLQRKIGLTWKNTRAFEEANRAFAEAVAILDCNRTEEDPIWRYEWIEAQVERITVYYWLNQPEEMQTLSESIKSFLEAYATLPQRRHFASHIALIDLRRGRFTIPRDTITRMHEEIRLQEAWGYNSEDIYCRFILGFLHLWHGDLDDAEHHLQISLTDSEHLGDVTILSRALAYLTVIRRKRQQVDDTRIYAERLLKTSSIGQMTEYIASAYGHQAWVALREGNIEEAQELARQGFQQMSIVPIGKVIIWITLWPLISTEIINGQVEEAVQHVKVLTGPTQQPQPEAVQHELESALQKWDAQDIDGTYQHLLQANQLAYLYGYV